MLIALVAQEPNRCLRTCLSKSCERGKKGMNKKLGKKNARREAKLGSAIAAVTLPNQKVGSMTLLLLYSITFGVSDGSKDRSLEFG
jgi:hypothetical protein